MVPCMIATMKSCLRTVLALAIAVQGGGDFVGGAQAYRERRFAAAAAAFSSEVAARGAAAPAELHYDLALAWLAAGESSRAAGALEVASRSPDVALRRRCNFVRGSIAWQRGAAAAKLAEQVEAEPFAFRPALAAIEAARLAWQQAAIGEPDWPEARRNVERAQQRLLALRDAQQRLEQQRRGAGGATPRPLLVPNGTDSAPADRVAQGQAQDAQDNPLAPLRTELTPTEVEALFRQVDAIERQKRELRRRVRERAGDPGDRAVTGRDW